VDEKFLESSVYGGISFEPGRVQIGQVVGDDIHIYLAGGHPAGSDVKTFYHLF
jgi:hypothetical protein